MKLSLLSLSLAAALPLGAEVTAVAHPEEKFPTEATVVWSPLFQAAWDRLNEVSGGKPQKIVPPNPLMEKLDRFEWISATVMPATGWGVWAGPTTPEFLEQANREAAALSNGKEPAFRLEDETPGGIAVFGLLERTVEFEKAFFRSTRISLSFGEAPVARNVEFFGVKGDASGDFARQVKVLAYRPSEKCHALELSCKGAMETVLLYRSPAGTAQDFTTACHWLRTWRKRWKPDKAGNLQYDDPALHRLDEVRVPYLKLDLKADFQERLTALRFREGQELPQEIARAEEKVEFELHERGARVRVTVELEAMPFSDVPEPPQSFPRVFAYDAPFFVFLWREGAEWPYFGAWVGDASAMKAWEGG